MPGKTQIEWATDTWNPVTGCTKVSAGCAHCYITQTPPFRIAGRKFDKSGATGLILYPERLDQPIRWKRPRVIFVNSLSDLFHEEIPYEFMEKVFDVMGEASHHTFQVLTKRPKEMLAFLDRYYDSDAGPCAPWPNVWLGVTIENSRHTWRADYLRAANAAVRFISAEPLLGSLFQGDGATWPTTIQSGMEFPMGWPPLENKRPLDLTEIDWVIAGGESGGPKSRPMDPVWPREIRDACLKAGVAYFFKQWGSWRPSVAGDEEQYKRFITRSEPMTYVGANGKSGGKALDGEQWCEFPEAAAA